MDDAKAHAISQQVSQWLRDSDKLSDAEFATRRQVMEDSARKIVGDVPPMQVLNNWMQDQMAVLLSNPQLPQAIEAVLKCRLQAN
jgi:GTP1/Obg family GTP-binding protein